MGYTILYSEAYTLTGFGIAGLLGAVFILSCIISVAKAVRDRREIKARIQAKKAGLNGHAHKAGGGGGGSGKSRPNILIIHDEEKGRRLKNSLRNGRTGKASASDSEAGTSSAHPSAFSSPSELHTETTTAEVSWHRGDSSSNTTPAGRAESTELGLTVNGHCRAGAGGHDGDTHPAHSRSGSGIDFSSYVIHPHHHTKLNGRLPNGNATGHVGRDCLGQGLKEHAVSESNITDYTQLEAEEGRGDGKDGSSAPDSSCHFSRGVASSSSFHGFSTKHKHVHRAVWHRKEQACARYNARRNSYTVTIPQPHALHMQPLASRRHSDEPQLSLFRSCACGGASPDTGNATVSMRNYNGADNPAYDGADDIVAM